MKDLITFVSNNRAVLLGMLIGFIVGFLYWFYIGCYSGLYPLSSECWINCSYGLVLGGLITSVIKNNI